MDISNKWQLYTILSVFLHASIVLINQGFWIELDSPVFIALARTQSLSYCTPVGYPIFLWIFGIGAKYLYFPLFIQIILRCVITGLIIVQLKKQFHLSNTQSLIAWIIFHLEPQQLYYNTCLMAESLLCTLFLFQWYFWQRYVSKQQNTYMWLLIFCSGIALYIKPIAMIGIILLLGYTTLTLKHKYRFFLGTLFVYAIFHISVSSLYYWRYNTFQTDIFKGILLWNNVAVLTPTLKKNHFQTKDKEVNLVLQTMYQRPDSEYAFEQDDNRIFEDNSFTQDFIQFQMKQGKTYRQAIVYTNHLLGKVAEYIIIHYPVSFIREYVFANTKEWLKAIILPHSITYPVPQEITFVHTHAKVYRNSQELDFLHSILKLGFIGLAVFGTIRALYKKQSILLRYTLPIWLFIAMYMSFNIVLHPLEYRYIYPVLLGLHLITLCHITYYLSKKSR